MQKFNCYLHYSSYFFKVKLRAGNEEEERSQVLKCFPFFFFLTLEISVLATLVFDKQKKNKGEKRSKRSLHTCWELSEMSLTFPDSSVLQLRAPHSSNPLQEVLFPKCFMDTGAKAVTKNTRTACGA